VTLARTSDGGEVALAAALGAGEGMAMGWPVMAVLGTADVSSGGVVVVTDVVGVPVTARWSGETIRRARS